MYQRQVQMSVTNSRTALAGKIVKRKDASKLLVSDSSRSSQFKRVDAEHDLTQALRD